MKNISDNDYLYGHYVTTDNTNIIVKDLGLCPIFRLCENIIQLIAMYYGRLDGSFDHLMNEKNILKIVI